MKKLGKRVLSILLAVVMLFSVLAVAASAEEAPQTPEQQAYEELLKLREILCSDEYTIVMRNLEDGFGDAFVNTLAVNHEAVAMEARFNFFKLFNSLPIASLRDSILNYALATALFLLLGSAARIVTTPGSFRFVLPDRLKYTELGEDFFISLGEGYSREPVAVLDYSHLANLSPEDITASRYDISGRPCLNVTVNNDDGWGYYRFWAGKLISVEGDTREGSYGYIGNIESVKAGVDKELFSTKWMYPSPLLRLFIEIAPQLSAA